MRCLTANVEVYDVNTRTEQRRLPVMGLSDPFDIMSRAQHKCLFIIDWNGTRVYRVNLNGR